MVGNIHLRSDDPGWSVPQYLVDANWSKGFFRGQHGPQTNCGLLGSDGFVVFKLWVTCGFWIILPVDSNWARTHYLVPRVAVLRVEDLHGMQLLESSAKDVCSRVVLGKVLQTGCQVLYSGEPSWNPQCFGIVLEPPYHINESSNSCCGRGFSLTF